MSQSKGSANPPVPPKWKEPTASPNSGGPPLFIPPAWTPEPAIGRSDLPLGTTAASELNADGSPAENDRRTLGQRLTDRLASWRQFPSWLVSMICHLILLLVLALIQLPGMQGSALTLLLGESSEGEAEFDLSLSASPLEDSLQDSSEVAQPLPVIESVPNSIAEVLDVQEMELPGLDQPASNVATPVQLTNLLDGRRAGNKEGLLKEGGGSQQTEDAVEMGLQWLARQQQSDGGWSLRGPYSDGALLENRTAATAMALNAFLGAGYTHLDGKYSSQIKFGLEFLRKRQNSRGFFADGEPGQQRAYAQAIATITVLEAYGLTKDPELVAACRQAVHYAQWAQSRLKGWRYEPQRDADVSVTGWFVMALQTAYMAGFEVDEEKLQSVHEFLDSVGHRDLSAYSYNELHAPDLTMTAEALLCRILLGWPREHSGLQKGVEELTKSPPDEDEKVQSVYYWYYATQVMHHYGGEPWQKWNRAMKRTLPRMQNKSGTEKGSWSPQNDHYGSAGGRLYTTCLNIYCLEVYYRHLAIYSIK